MTIANRRALQPRLTAAGFDAGVANGMIGSRTSDAIMANQQHAGPTVTGEPSRRASIGRMHD
jgi:membrane-bound lytic murein transglycosylase B